MAKAIDLDSLYAVTHEQAITAVLLLGTTISQFIEGPIGIGKSSLLPGCAERNGDKWRRVGDHFPEDKYVYVYLDCGRLDFGDLALRVPNVKTGTVDLMPTSLLCMNDPRPKIIMLDERGKAPRNLQPTLTRLDLERCVDDMPLPQGSIVFSTSNLSTDGVGDTVLSHTWNRNCRLRLRGASMEGWLAWASKVGLDSRLRATASMNPRFFECYTDGDRALDNPFIMLPGVRTKTFLSMRSLAMCNPIICNSDVLGEAVTMAALAGTVGAAAAEQMMAVLRVQGDVEDPNNVLANPLTAKVPTKIAALYVTMFNVLDKVQTQDDLSNFMEWVARSNSVEMESVAFTIVMRHPTLTLLGKNNAKIRTWAKANMDMLG